MHLTINGKQIEVTDCRSWRVVGMTPSCAQGLPLNCDACPSREARKGDGTDPPIYEIPQTAIRAPRTPAAPLPPRVRVGGARQGPTPPKPPQRLRGLGDVVAKVAAAVGIRPTKGCKCKERQAALNRLVPFGKDNPPPASQPPAGADGGERMV